MTAQMATRLTLRTFKHKKRKVSRYYFHLNNEKHYYKIQINLQLLLHCHHRRLHHRHRRQHHHHHHHHHRHHHRHHHHRRPHCHRRHFTFWKTPCQSFLKTSSVASPICQEGQSKKNLPDFGLFFPIFPLFLDFFPIFPLFLDFSLFFPILTIFSLSRGHSAPLALYWLCHCWKHQIKLHIVQSREIWCL